MTRAEALTLFSKGFSEFLKRNGFTLEYVGSLLGCSKANVSNIRNGKTAPSFENLLILVEHGMTLEEVFGPELARRIASPPPTRPPVPETPLEKARYVRAGLRELLEQLSELDARLPDPPKSP